MADQPEQTEPEQAELEQAELEQAELEQAELEQAELEQAELQQAELQQAELELAELELAELEQAEPEQAEPDPQVSPQRWHWLASPLRLLKRLPGFTRVAQLFSTRPKQSSGLEEVFDAVHNQLMNHIQNIEQNIHAVQQQLLEHVPEFAESYPQHTPGTLHQFQQFALILLDIQAQEEGRPPGTLQPLSLQERRQFRRDNRLQ